MTRRILAPIVGAILAATANAQTPLQPVVTYQGFANAAGVPLDGTADFTVQFFDAPAGGAAVTPAMTLLDVPIDRGRFVLTLDLADDAILNGDDRWLELTVNGELLTPRQPLSPAPYALRTKGIDFNQTDGFVGIGRSNPVSPDEVFGVHYLGPGLGGMFVSAPVGSDPLYGYSTDGAISAYHWWDSSDSKLKFRVGGSQALTMDTAGNLSAGFIGIGVPTPNYPIEIYDSTKSRALRVTKLGGVAIYATVEGSNSNGIVSLATGFNATGVRALADSADATALVAQNFRSGGLAAQFLGDIQARDKLSIGSLSTANTLFAVADLPGTGAPASHVALIENTTAGQDADILALKAGVNDLTPNSPVNFITFFNRNDASLGAIQGGGASVVLAGAGNDYAEYLPQLTESETFEPGDVVAVRAGKITRDTTDARNIMVVSTEPIVLGNRPREDDDGLPGWHKIAFIGQAPVKVRGPANPGDLILPSGRNDGTGLAIAPQDTTPAQLTQVLGVAWERSTATGVAKVNCAIGIDQADAAAAVLEAQRQEIQAQRTLIEDQQRRADDLESRLDKLENLLATQR